YKSEDIEYLKQNTSENMEVMPVEELFFKYFSLEETEEHREIVIKNQGEILDFLSTATKIKITKYDVKDIFVKNKLKYKTYRDESNVKCGVKLFQKVTDKVPF